MITPFAYTAKLNECGSKHLALYLAIREAITEGKLAPGEKLPSTRQLAELYSVSRGSVSVAYEMLTAEGFVQAGIGQGTFVAGSEHDDDFVSPKRIQSEDGGTKATLNLTRWGSRILQQAERLDPTPTSTSTPQTHSVHEDIVSFVPEGVGTQWFPWDEWKAEVAKQWKECGSSHRSGSGRGSGEAPTEGSALLREAIARRLRLERGIPCEANEIIVTSGSMQAIALLTQLLLEEGRTAVIENPCYTGIQRAVHATSAKVIAQDIDLNGIVPEDWEAQLLFVTPSRQFPTGVVLSYERRRALLSWAARHNAWIIEDDYDSDFRWGGRPIEPLKSLDREGRVIYVGTFSRAMSVGVRIGYAVVPQPLIKPLLAAKQLYDPYPTGIMEQQALASWMSEGGYDRHMRRMRRIYGKLEKKLRISLEYELGGLFEVTPSDAGLHLYARWKCTSEQYESLVQQCKQQGVIWREGARYDTSHPKPFAAAVPSALFGFAHLNEEQINEGINRIRQAALSLGLLVANQGEGGIVDA